MKQADRPYLLPIALAIVAIVTTLPNRSSGADPYALIRGELPGGQRPRWMGTGSCASSACHNANAFRGRASVELLAPDSQSEYTYWNTYDPHAKAHAVLDNEKSRQIVEKLGRQEYGGASNDSLCLSCHVHQGYEGAVHDVAFSVSDGVGCESCHGPAEFYLAPHVSAGWRAMPAEQKADYGLVPDDTLADRARMCMSCHVGSPVPDAAHGLVDVNHDLIAAGHPRMNFEFASYHAMYPKHWSDREDQAYDPGREARAWSVGQLATAEAALKLLAARAGLAEESAPDSEPPALPGPDPHAAPWPEFAEYNCYACHHDLQGGLGAPAGIPGTPPWGTWYFTANDVLAEQFPPPGGDLRALLDDLNKEMAVPYPDPAEVRRIAESAAGQLGPWIDSMLYRPIDAAKVRELMVAVVEDARERAEAARSTGELAPGEVPRLEGPTWDDNAQAFLALAALYQAMGDLRPSAQDPSTRMALEGMARSLEFSRGLDSPDQYRADPLSNELQLISRQLGR